MGNPPALSAGFIFMLACILFAGVGGYLILQVIGDNLDSQSATIMFAPLGLCWLGIFLTLNTGPVAIPRILFVAAFLWCVIVPLRVKAVGQQVSTRLLDERISGAQKLAQAYPDNPNNRFKLAELYEDRGHKREAYAEYAATLMLDRHNTRARSRSRHLYKEITGKEMPEDAVPPIVPGGPPSAASSAMSADASAAATPPIGASAVPAVSLPDFTPTILPGGLPGEPGFSTASASGETSIGGAGGSGGANGGTESGGTAIPATGLQESPRLQSLRESIMRGPVSDRLYASVAEELLKAGRTAEAAEAYRQALNLNPTNDHYRFNLQALDVPVSDSPLS